MASSAIVALLCIFSFASSSEIVAVLGTENGYDGGGPEPVCWKSQFEYNETTITANKLNAVLWDTLTSSNASSIDLLPRCDSTTNLSVHLLMDEEEDKVAYTNFGYEFEINLSVEITNYTAVAFVRLQFCDALQYGFCNPIPNIMVDAESGSVKVMQDKRLAVTEWNEIVLRDSVTDQVKVLSMLRIPKSLPEGVYYVIAHAIVINDDDSGLISRLDIGRLIQGNILHVVEPPVLQDVTMAVKVSMGVAIGICGSFALVLLVFIIVHRNHAVMRLAQGSFLAAISAGCFIQIVFSFVLYPTKSVYCQLVGVLCLLPMTFVASCMVGRIWRVYQTLSNVNRFGRNRNDKKSLVNATGDSVVSALTSIANWTALTPRRESRNDALQRRSSLRQSISAKETSGLVLFLTMPQLLLQVITACISDRGLALNTDITGSFQRKVCEEKFRWAAMVGTAYVVFVCILAVALSWIARDLPSAFNEKDQVYRAASLSIFITFVAISLSDLLNDPTTHPNLAVVLHGTWSLVVPMSVLTMIVFPKVKRVMSGEKVVMSNIIGGRFSVFQHSHGSSWQPHEHRQEITAGETVSTGQSLPKPLQITVESRRISLETDDPLPAQVEGLLFDVQRVLRAVTQKIMQGRAPSRVDLTRLGEEVALLSDELTLIDFVNTLQSDDNKLNAAVPSEPVRIKVVEDQHNGVDNPSGVELERLEDVGDRHNGVDGMEVRESSPTDQA